MPQKYLRYSSLLLLVLLLILLAKYIHREGKKAQYLAQGERLFQIHCASCHGPKGEGGRGPTLAVPRLSRASTKKLLKRVIRSGIPGTEMGRSSLSEEQISQVAAWVDHIGQALPGKVMPGNVERGEHLYFTKGNCNQCHAIKGYGGALGPDLTEIGLSRSAAYLRTALIDPEADVPTNTLPFRFDVRIPNNFLQVTVVMKNGQSITGVRINEDTYSIQVRDSSDRIHSFFKSELVELHKEWSKSPMPSYRNVFSEEELDDVVAFLVSLRGER
jgi:cytochrome c oxidase cbb3-type subunit 3